MGRRRTVGVSFVCYLCGARVDVVGKYRFERVVRWCTPCRVQHKFCKDCWKKANDLAIHGTVCPKVTSVMNQVEGKR